MGDPEEGDTGGPPGFGGGGGGFGGLNRDLSRSASLTSDGGYPGSGYYGGNERYSHDLGLEEEEESEGEEDGPEAEEW